MAAQDCSTEASKETGTKVPPMRLDNAVYTTFAQVPDE